jgi:hypothetical protein
VKVICEIEGEILPKSIQDKAHSELNKLKGRSRISNDRAAFLQPVDGRSYVARRYRDVVAQIITDTGGDPSEAQLAIIRRAATLIVWAEQAELQMAEGKPIDIGAYTTACNSLRRLLADVGLARKARDVTGDTLLSRFIGTGFDPPATEAETDDGEPE